MVKYLNLEKAVDCMIDKMPYGAPVRDGIDLYRVSDRFYRHLVGVYPDPRVRRRWFALQLIVRACKDGVWKANGKKPGSAEREHIPDIAFIDSEINWDTGDLMTQPGILPGSLFRGRGSKEAIWTDLRFSVPDSANQGEAADTKGGQVGRRPASQSQAEKVQKAFDERSSTFTFKRGEMTRVANEIGEATGYKQNTVEKLIRSKYRELEETQK